MPYLLLIDYSAPRFLLPAYALLALPVAGLAAHTVAALRHTTGRRVRLATTGVLAVLLAAHLGAQFGVLQHNLADARATAGRYQATADALHRLGVAPPCLVAGAHASPVAYDAGCAPANVGGNNRNTTAHALRLQAADQPAAALGHTHSAPPFYASTWAPHPIPGTGLTAYVAPRAR